MVVIVNRADVPDVAQAIGKGAVSIAGDVTDEAHWGNVAGEVEGRFGRAEISGTGAAPRNVGQLPNIAKAAGRSCGMAPMRRGATAIEQTGRR